MRPEDLLKKSFASEKRALDLRPCKACGQPIATTARTCPHCGKSYTTAGGVFIAVIIALILGGFFLSR